MANYKSSVANHQPHTIVPQITSCLLPATKLRQLGVSFPSCGDEKTKPSANKPNTQLHNRICKPQSTNIKPPAAGLPAQQLAGYKSPAVPPRQSRTVGDEQIYKSQDTSYKAVVLCRFCRSSQTPENPQHQTKSTKWRLGLAVSFANGGEQAQKPTQTNLTQMHIIPLRG